MARNAAIFAAVLTLLATDADATTVNFTFSNGATPVAEGAFSYATGSTGVLGYADLTAFSIHFDVPNVTYDLAFALANTNYQYFAYNTAIKTFVLGIGTGTVGSFTELLGTINNALSDGFFIVPNVYHEYSTLNAELPYTELTISEVIATPLPAALPLFATGAGVLGFIGWRRRRRLA